MKQELKLILAMLIEWIALSAFFFHIPTNLQLLIFVVPHFIASIMMGKLVYQMMPRKLRQHQLCSTTLFASFSFFIPFFGILALFGIIYFILQKKTILQTNYIEVLQEKLSEEAPTLSTPTPFGPSGTLMCLQQEDVPIDKKIQAVMMIGAENTPFSNNYLRKLLHSNNDQLRLLAFSLLDKQEKKISNIINKLTTMHSSSIDEVKMAKISLQLAELYWDLVYLQLVEGQLGERYLNEVVTNLDIAEAVLPDDYRIAILRGRLALHHRDYQGAFAAFSRAEQCGAPVLKYISYLAECYYRRRDFTNVNKLFAEHSELQFLPVVGPLYSFWTGSANECQ